MIKQLPRVVPFLIFVALCRAGPMIQVDTTEYFAGTFIEGQVDTISHDFTIRNPGDEPLYILKVNPGCGCTKFDVDKMVPPGGIGKISIKVEISKFKGSIKKTTSMLTDADNQQMVRFVMKAKVNPVITLSKEFVRFEENDKSVNVGIKTDKKDLKITSVKYKAYLTGTNHVVDHTLIKDKVQDKKDVTQYTLTLKPQTKPSQTSPGQFIIVTNHPRKKSVEIGGLILIGRN